MKTLFLLGLLLLIAVAPVYAENETDSSAYSETFALALEKAVIQAEEIISKIQMQGNDTTELESILDELVELNGTQIASREEYKELRESAKEVVRDFREAARTYVPEDKREELRKIAKEKAKERLEKAKERFAEMRERFNERQLAMVAKRLMNQANVSVAVKDLREAMLGNLTPAEVREKVRQRVANILDNREEFREAMKERIKNARENMQERKEDMREKHSELTEEMKERAEDMKEIAMDAQEEAEELTRQYEAGELTLEEYELKLSELRRESMKDIMGDGPMADMVADIADTYEEEFKDEMDTDDDGEISEEEARNMVSDLGIEVPAR